MNTNTKIIERAKFFATIAHDTQTYNNEVPYIYHLEMVASTVAEYVDFNPRRDSLIGLIKTWLICGGYLHDVIEDTNRSYNDILKRFGYATAEMCYCVTNEIGRNRKERNIRTYPKISSNLLAVVLKLADRLSNVMYGIETGSDMPSMYKKEHDAFIQGIMPHMSNGHAENVINSTVEQIRHSLSTLENLDTTYDIETIIDACWDLWGIAAMMANELERLFREEVE